MEFHKTKGKALFSSRAFSAEFQRSAAKASIAKVPQEKVIIFHN